MRKCIIALFFISLNALGQTGNYKCSEMWLKPDYSGLQEAKTYNDKAALLLRKSNIHDTVKAKACNSRGIYFDFAGQQDSAIVWYQKSLSYLNNYPKLKVYNYINTANAQEVLTNYSDMLALGKKALSLSEVYGTQVQKALAYQIMASAYFRTDELEKAIEHLLKGIAILEKEHNTCYLGLLKLNLANTYIQTNNYKFATDLFEDYLHNNTIEKGSKRYTIAIVNYTECLIELQQYIKAKELLTNALPDVRHAGDRELEAVLYSRLGNLEDKENHIEASLNNYKKAYELLNRQKSRFSTNIFSGYLDVLNKAKRYNEALALAISFKDAPAYRKSTAMERFSYETAVADIYKKTNRYTDANTALTEAVRLCDSLRQINNGYSEQKVQAGYQTKFQRDKNELLAKNNVALSARLKTEKQLLLMYLLVSIAGAIVILLYLRGLRLRSRLQKEKLKNMETDTALAIQQQQHEKELIASQKNIIEEKQRESASIALQLADHYNKLNQLIEKFGTPGYDTTPDIKKELLQLIKQKDYWKQFETRFNDLNPGFAITLSKTYPRLTKNDIEFCSLIKLKLTYKEIASLLQISHESVITKKYRIRKKMDLNDEVEFEQMLAEM